MPAGTGIGSSLLGLANFLNQRIADRRPGVIEGATPVGRTGTSLPGTGAGGAPGFGGTGAKPGSTSALDLGGLPGAGSGLAGASDQTANNGDTGGKGPNAKQSAKIEKKIGRETTRIPQIEAKATAKETAIGERGNKRMTRIERRTDRKETRLGKKDARLDAKSARLTAAGKLGKAAKVEKRDARVENRMTTVAAHGKAREDAVASRTFAKAGKVANRATAKVGKINTKITKQHNRLFGS